MDGPEREDLTLLAGLWGVETRYVDANERAVHPSTEAICAVLRAVGAPIHDLSDVPDAVRSRRAELEGRILEPVTVLSSGRGRVVRRGPALPVGEEVEVAVSFEDGRVRHTVAPVGPRGIALPLELPEGVHELEAVHASGSATSRLVVAPARAHRPPQEEAAGEVSPLRDWGAFLPLHALRTERDRGVGDLTDLERMLRWVDELGGAAVGMLPLLAAFLDEPFETSPYAPASRLFWNEIYLDPVRLPEWKRAPPAGDLLNSSAFQERIQRVRQARLVDYREVYRLQAELLQPLADAWHDAGGERDEECRRFLDERPDALGYAAFRAAGEARGERWDRWPAEWRTRGIPPQAFDSSVFRRHLYAQLSFPKQLEEVAPSIGAGAGLYLDLPLGAHPAGFDSWANPELFAGGATIGAPPDPYHAEGQDWGLLPARPDAARAEGHGHFREILARMLPHARYLRIDHVMGLHRLYWVPRGMSAGEGTYVRYPADELYAILCLESRRNRSLLVGEDLGTVPPETRREMDARGVRRMYVVPFQLDPESAGGLAPVPAGVVASLNTHDLPTFAAAWESDDTGQPLRDAAGTPDPREGLIRLLERLGRSAAGLVVASLEDLWLEEDPQNVPGGSDPTSWRRRARLSLSEIINDPRVLEALRALRKARAEAGA